MCRGGVLVYRDEFEQCLCVSLFDGSTGCLDLTAECGVECPDGTCPPGFTCIVNTCCGETTCIPNEFLESCDDPLRGGRNGDVIVGEAFAGARRGQPGPGIIRRAGD